MKFDLKLVGLTLLYYLINSVIIWMMISGNGNTSIVYMLIVFPLFWLIYAVILIVLSSIYKGLWFKKSNLIPTILMLFLCTPTILILVHNVNQPEINRSSSNYSVLREDGTVLKSEEWTYTESGDVAILKYWIKPKEAFDKQDDSFYLKDSVWCYFDKRGDTLKKEIYNEDKLMQTILLKE